MLADALMLTDAFTHISKIDTCVSLLQRIMVADSPTNTKGDGSSDNNRSEQCALFMREIYVEDTVLAARVGDRMIGFCAGTLEDAKKMIVQEIFPVEAKRQAKVASSTACAILSVMRDQCAARVGSTSNINSLREFQTISKLQSGCDIFLTVQELRNPSSCASVVVDLLQPSVNLLLARMTLLEMNDDELLCNELKPLVATARQWCTLLCDTPDHISHIWSRAIGAAASKVAKISTNHGSLLLLEVSALLDERNTSSYHAIMSVALTLCERAFSEARYTSQDDDFLTSLIAMRSMAQASQLINNHVLLHCPPSLLSSSLSLGNLVELVCDISTRSDMGIGERLEKYINMLQVASRKHRQHEQMKDPANMLADKRLPSAPNLHPTWYIGDGLLLQPLEALSLSMSYCQMMLNMESTSSSYVTSKPGALMDKNAIMHSLESKGAHATAHRVLMLSTAASLSRNSTSASTSLMFNNGESMLRKNICVLAERSLGGNESGLTSGNIDVHMSVSCLLHLPKEMAFKVRRRMLILVSFCHSIHLTGISISTTLPFRSIKQHCHPPSVNETSHAYFHWRVSARTVASANSRRVKASHGANNGGSSNSVMNYHVMLCGGGFSLNIALHSIQVSSHNREMPNHQQSKQCRTTVRS